jgi:signal transduction histidine kinase
MASHEFRTPLSTIQLSASLIDKYAEPAGMAEISKHVNKIKASVTGLTAILNNFLQIEKLESGKVEAHLSDFDLKELATEITEEMQLLSKPNQKISYKNLTESTAVRLDKNLIKNCIINLLTNAIKYSDENAIIEFSTEIDSKKCTISVKDNGIGIPPEDQKHLFGAFFRAHNTGNILGTGLGLHIVARHVELMNGEVTFDSNTDNGTLFTLTFPTT